MQLSYKFYLLVTCFTTLTSAIRVYWNTNEGPIVPPVPRTTVGPMLPYREPAPVWEAQSNDIPNPNSYVYILPPPSRPRPATNNYLTFDRQPVSQTNYNNYKNNKNYDYILTPNQGNSYNKNSVGGLTVKYVPNVGNKYYAIVPSGKTAYAGAKLQAAAAAPTGYYFDNNNNNGDKLQGKYNAKTKKYKVYEKVKYSVPTSNYFPIFYSEQPNKRKQQYEQQFAKQQLLETQQLPVVQNVQHFRVEATPKAEQQPQQQQLLIAESKLNEVNDASLTSANTTESNKHS